MRTHYEDSVWVGTTFALFVSHGVVKTCISDTMARRGHWKSPSFDPKTEFDRLTGLPPAAIVPTPKPIANKTPKPVLTDPEIIPKGLLTQDAILRALSVPKRARTLAEEFGVSENTMGKVLTQMRARHKVRASGPRGNGGRVWSIPVDR